jgi:dienelactone hydrolase
LEQVDDLGQADGFHRYSIRYPSDGLTIGGFIDIPDGDGPFPVIIALHGYVPPEKYRLLDYTTDAADGLAQAGYFVIHPALRNFPPSDNGDVRFRVGYAIDVLNLIALVQKTAGKPGLLQQANARPLGIWSHNLGGGIALKVAVVSKAVKAILLYAPLSGDEQKNSQFFYDLAQTEANTQELQTPADVFASLSADHYYRDVTAAIQVHYGTADTVVPPDWSDETCKKLQAAHVQVDCFTYDGAEHTFRAVYLDVFGPRMSDFFAKYLK